MKRFLYILSVLIFFAAMSYAQDEEESYFDLQLEDPLEEIEIEDEPLLKPHYNLTLGSSFGFMPGYGSMTTMYVAPGVSLPLNKRLSIHTGIVATSFVSQAFNLPGENSNIPLYSNFAVYGAVSYMLNENLMIFTSGTKQLGNTKGIYPFMPANRFSFGSSLKLSDNLTIGASFTTTDSWEPLSPFSPMSGSGMYPLFIP